MARQSCTGCGRVGLDGITLVEQSLLIELLEQVPERLDVLVVVGDVGVLEVHPVAHLVGQLCPLVRVHHHILAAGIVVVIDRNLLADVFLRDAQRLLHAQFYRQAVCVPARLALHLEALHGLVA